MGWRLLLVFNGASMGSSVNPSTFQSSTLHENVSRNVLSQHLYQRGGIPCLACRGAQDESGEDVKRSE